MKRGLVIKITSLSFLALIIYSFVPVIVLYFQQVPPALSNEAAVKKLAGKTGDRFEFIVMGDNHSGLIFNDSAALKLARRINREDRFRKLPVDFVMIAGDLTLRGSGWDYAIFIKLCSRIKYPVISSLGNHDDDGANAELFKNIAGEAEFSFVNRNSYFIVIDNSAGEITNEQFAWLEEELKKSMPYQHRFVIAHKPPFSPYQQSWYRPELGSWPLSLMKLCERYNVDMIFSGHEHMFKEQTFGKARYITTGGGGMLTHFPRQDGGFLHYVVVRVYGDYCDYEVRKIFPPLWEFLAYYMWKDIFYFLVDAIY